MAATLKDIAEKLNISVTTVSRGLAGYEDVAAETKQRIRETAVALGYTPNLQARRLQKQRSDTLGFIIPTENPRFSDPFFSELIAGIGNKAAAHDYDLLVSTHAPESEAEINAYRRAANGGWVDGLILVRTRINDSRVQILHKHSFPFIAFGRTDDDLNFPFVDEDSHAGMKLVVQHLINLGHRRIGFITPPQTLMFGRYRQQGYFDAMATNNLPVEPAWVVEGNLTQRGGAEAANRLLQIRPYLTAIVAGNDLMAIGAINQIQQAGFQVGREIAVVGFDDIPSAAYTNPPLTTVHQPLYDIGQTACGMLIDLVNGRSLENKHVLLTPTLVVRASSGVGTGI